MSEMKQCSNGHFYYPDKSPSCPYCNPATESQQRTISVDGQTDSELYGQGTVPPQDDTHGNLGAITPVANGNNFSPDNTIGRTEPAVPPTDIRRTEAVIKKTLGIDPVVGWLVCTEGTPRGTDYRIRGGNNRIGRGRAMDISIAGDATISEEDAAYVTYDLETHTFIFVAGRGKNVVRVNGQLLPVNQSRELHPYDLVKLGQTTLAFVPFCGEKFNWQ